MLKANERERIVVPYDIDEAAACLIGAGSDQANKRCGLQVRHNDQPLAGLQVESYFHGQLGVFLQILFKVGVDMLSSPWL